MGVVYKARQVALDRLVAVKMIRDAQGADADLRERFRTEAQAVARLQHPHVVQIHEVGEYRSLPFFSMEFCAGGSLLDQLDGTPWEAPRAAQLIQTLAGAMQAAHHARIVHRDLKPANVLLTADGTPKVTDFGLAKKIDEQGQTQTGAILGTPSYMAPEQAGARAAAVGPAADVYALGVILYELLTGRPPFKAATSLDTIWQVLHQEPVPVRRLQPQVPRDLETICLTCLRKEPGRRYATAGALADDLGRFLRGEPIRARPTGRLERALKWARRRPALAGLAAACLVAVLSAAGAVVWHGVEMQRANEDLRLEKRRAEEAAAEARQNAANTQTFAGFLAQIFESSEALGLRSYGFYSGSQKATDLTARQILAQGARLVREQLSGQPAYQATMLDTLGNAYRSLGQYDEAKALLAEGLEIRRRVLGEDHPDTATSWFHQGWLQHDLGDYAGAEQLYEKALAVRSKHLGADHPLVADVLFNLGWLHSHQLPDPQPSLERSLKAEQLFREVLRIRRAQPVQVPKEIGFAQLALAAVLLGRGDHDLEAAALIAQAGDIFRNPDERPDKAANALMLFMAAERARQKRDFAQAEALHRQVLDIARRELGEEHPLTGLVLGNFAGLLRQRGDMENAERALRQALDIGRRSPLRWHPAMADAIKQLADHVKDRDGGKEAEQLYREALRIARYRLPRDHPRCVEITSKLAELLRKQGRSQEAETLEQAAK
jgi:tetratricopeptide (TPR) repeat protein